MWCQAARIYITCKRPCIYDVDVDRQSCHAPYKFLVEVPLGVPLLLYTSVITSFSDWGSGLANWSLPHYTVERTTCLKQWCSCHKHHASRLHIGKSSLCKIPQLLRKRKLELLYKHDIRIYIYISLYVCYIGLGLRYIAFHSLHYITCGTQHRPIYNHTISHRTYTW